MRSRRASECWRETPDYEVSTTLWSSVLFHMFASEMAALKRTGFRTETVPGVFVFKSCSRLVGMAVTSIPSITKATWLILTVSTTENVPNLIPRDLQRKDQSLLDEAPPLSFHFLSKVCCYRSYRLLMPFSSVYFTKLFSASTISRTSGMVTSLPSSYLMGMLTTQTS